MFKSQNRVGPIELEKPFMAKQFRFMVNILMLFQRLHECQQLPGLSALPVGTFLGFVSIGFGNSNIDLNKYR